MNKGFSNVYHSYKGKAKRRGYGWNLSKDHFMELTQQDCYYCGIHPNQATYIRGDTFVYNGVDRVDNELGYFIGNVVPCCWICNRAKGNMTEEAFFHWVKRIYKKAYEISGTCKWGT